MRKYFLSILVLMLIIFSASACSKNTAHNKTENIEKEKVEAEAEINNGMEETSLAKEESEDIRDLTPAAKENKNKNLKVVAGSKQVLDLLEKFGYENIIAVPENSIKEYKDAVSIGYEKTPNLDIINSFYGDWGEDVIFITDGKISYAKEFTDNLKLPYMVLSFENGENGKENYYAIGSALGLEKTAEDLVNNI